VDARIGRLAVASLAVALASPAGAEGLRAGPPLVYFAMGDSTAVGDGAEEGGGYPARLARRLEEAGIPVKLAVVAASGATAADVRRDQLPRVQAARPGLVTIGVGLNDVLEGRKLADFARDLQVLADFVRRTKATVVIQTLPDVSLAPASTGSVPALARRIEAYNAAIVRAAERHGFVVADVWSATRRELRDRPGELFAEDGLHPSDAGYELWADALWPTIEAAVVAPRVQARRPPVH
jgi:lysophospholipase L1-like esterase